MQTKRLIRCALFSCIALVIFVLEAQIPPPVAIPGIKIGLSNAVTLAALYILGGRDTFFILMIRIILGNIFTGQAVSLLYSLCGGLLCFGVSVCLKNFFGKNTLWALGVIGSVFHNIGQIIAAILVMKSSAILVYLPPLLISGVVAGVIVGLVSGLVLKKVKPYILK